LGWDSDDRDFDERDSDERIRSAIGQYRSARKKLPEIAIVAAQKAVYFRNRLSRSRAPWTTGPPPLARKPATGKLRIEGAKGGVAAFFGTWPGDETDEQLLASLKEIRG
jgi:hypothetical protein